MQSTLDCKTPRHVAIIMDGNGRWAERRGLPRSAGHRAGIEAVRGTVEAASARGITTLSLFAFSSDNWRRPSDEVRVLMALFRTYLRAEIAGLVRNGIRLSFIGRRDRLPRRLEAAMRDAEQASEVGARLHLRIAIDYSSRDAIVRAAAQCAASSGAAEDWRQHMAHALAGPLSTGDVDLLIRTGGEKRLSDFLLWESAYAELWFTDLMWPDFGAATLGAALTDFRARERRFGGLVAAAASGNLDYQGENREHVTHDAATS